METQSKKILVVEDDKALSMLLVSQLTNEGFVVSENNNGVDGLEAALKDHPDLILLDIILPRMDGLTFLNKLREDAWGEKASVIIMSNLDDAEKVSEAMKRGVNDYFIKTDWKLEDVIAKIKRKLGV